MKSHIKMKLRIAGIATAIILFLISDIAEAQAGVVRRRTRRRTAVVVTSVTSTNNQQNTTEQQTPPPTPPVAENTGEAFPVGTVVTKLPEGCVSTPVGDKQYYHCGANYYQAVYKEGTLVYVTTEPPE